MQRRLVLEINLVNTSRRLELPLVDPEKIEVQLIDINSWTVLDRKLIYIEVFENRLLIAR